MHHADHHKPPGSSPDDTPAIAALRAYKHSMLLHRRLFMAAFAAEGIPHAQAGCLRMIVAHDGLSQADLAGMLQVSRPTVTSMLQKMEAAGTIERRDDERDSRITRVYATAEGRRIAKRLVAIHEDLAGCSFGRFSDADLAELGRLLTLLSQYQAEALETGDWPALAHPHHGHHEIEETR